MAKITNNSPKACLEFCKGYAYFGLGNGDECYCGNVKPEKVKATYRYAMHNCDKQCPGMPGAYHDMVTFANISIHLQGDPSRW